MSLIVESYNIEELCTAFGSNEKLLYQLRDELGNWLKLQPHLPQGASKKKLENFILGTKMSLELAKQKLDMYYTVRGMAPEIFANRDPRAPSFTALTNVLQCAWLPKLTPEKHTVSMYRAVIEDPDIPNPWQILRYLFVTCDIQMEECSSLGHIYIFDQALMKISHLKGLTPMMLQKFQMATKAYPIRIQAFHFVNAPPFIDRLINMIKAVISPKLASRFYVHPRGKIDSLYQYIPKTILPKDYGGDEISMDELGGMWHGKLDEWREWFIEQDHTPVDERLRPGGATDNKDELFGSAGSFRKLDID